MSTVGLFAIGLVVTLIVGAALGLLVYGAILDGRYAAEHSADEALGSRPASSPATGRQPEPQPEGTDQTCRTTSWKPREMRGRSRPCSPPSMPPASVTPSPTRAPSPSSPRPTTPSPLPHGTLQGLLADPPALARVLTYHVVPGRITSAQFTHDSEQKTVEGGVLKIARNGGVTVNDATVIQADVEAENGVIHVIDKVLIPPKQ
jgi:hypothetical protein